MTTQSIAEQAAPLPKVDAPAAERVRLDYLDGLRGLAACYVTGSHLYAALMFFSESVKLPAWLARVLGVFNIGQAAVDVFIVLSGYCLMIPIVRAGGALKGGFWGYIRRRATRILPPYYAALVGAIVVLEGLIAFGYIEAGTRSHLQPGVLISHLLVVHNWSEAWIHEIDPPMWSVAVEWQIYFLLPLLLLPIWRRFGPWASVLVGFAVGLGPHFLLHGAGDFSFPWFIGLFALGMAAATLNFGSDERSRALQSKVPWGLISLVVWVGAYGFLALKRGFYRNHQFLMDPIIGFATMALLVACTRYLRGPRETPMPLVLRVLGSRLAVWLGEFSYSIYLMHYPLVVLLWQLLLPLPLSPVARAAVMYGLGFPVIVGAAYLFHLAFERRFMPGHLARRP